MLGVLFFALCGGGAIWLSAVLLKKPIADFRKGSPLSCEDIGGASGLAVFGCLMLLATLWMLDSDIFQDIYLPSWITEITDSAWAVTLLIFGIPVVIGFMAYLISKACVTMKKHYDQIVEVRANRKKLKNIANISKKVDQESSAISGEITRLREIRALTIEEKSLIPNMRLISLLDAATDGDEFSLKECRSAVQKRQQLLQEEKSIEADIRELALRYRTIGDVDKCAYYLGYITEAVNFDKESALREIKSQQEKAERLKKLGRRYRRMAIILITVLVIVVGSVEGYNYSRYKQAVRAYNNQHYSESMKILDHIIGPYYGKGTLMDQSRTQLGWVYYTSYTSDGTLYVVSEDGNYTKQVDNNLETLFSSSAVDKNYLYYLKDGGAVYLLDMETNKKARLSIDDDVRRFCRKDNTLYAQGQIWDRSEGWYFDDEGGLISQYLYRLDGSRVSRIPDDDERYVSIEEIETVNLSPWKIEIGYQNDAEGLRFTNLQTKEIRFNVDNKVQEIIGYYKSNP